VGDWVQGKAAYMTAAVAGCANHMDFNYLQRVKVYRLNDEGKWDDKGTGHVSVEYLEVRFSLPCLWGMLENWLVVQSQCYPILTKREMNSSTV
jgi:hypothetical protein